MNDEEIIKDSFDFIQKNGDEWINIEKTIRKAIVLARADEKLVAMEHEGSLMDFNIDKVRHEAFVEVLKWLEGESNICNIVDRFKKDFKEKFKVKGND